MWKLISGLLLLAVVLLFAQWWLQHEGFRVSAEQAACDKAYASCIRKAVTADDAKLCNSVYNNCMKFPTDASGSTLPAYSKGIYRVDASGNRRLAVDPTVYDLTNADLQQDIAEYQKAAKDALDNVETTNPQIGPQLGSGRNTLVGYNQLGLYPTQANLDAAQGKNFVEETRGGKKKKGSKSNTDSEDNEDNEDSEVDDSTAPITTTIPPAGLTSSVENQIKRDTVQAVRDELKKLFANNEYLYKIED